MIRTWVPVVLLAAAAVVAVQARIDDPRRVATLGASVLAVLVVVLWVSARLRRPRIRDWRDAEHAAAQWLHQAGCRNVGLTGGSADGGIDVVTADWAVQVKHTSKRVGRPVVQQVVGASLTLDRQPAVIATSGFTAPAIDYAADHDVALLELDLDHSVHRLNAPADRIGKRSRRVFR